MEKPKIIFFGTPDFALKSLELINTHCDILCVVTSQDKKSGRGLRIHQSEVKKFSIINNILAVQECAALDSEPWSFRLTGRGAPEMPEKSLDLTVWALESVEGPSRFELSFNFMHVKSITVEALPSIYIYTLGARKPIHRDMMHRSSTAAELVVNVSFVSLRLF